MPRECGIDMIISLLEEREAIDVRDYLSDYEILMLEMTIMGRGYVTFGSLTPIIFVCT